MNRRPDRVGSLISRELGKIVQRDFDARGALITITDVIVDKKLDNARVKIGVIPVEKSAFSLGRLKRVQGEFQHLLNRQLNIRPMPRIDFEIDKGAENAANVEKLLIKEDN